MNAKDARIEMYFHCRNCMEELTEEKKRAIAAGLEQWHTNEKLAVGWTKQGLQVVCENCGHNVLDLDFMGQKVREYEPDDSQASNNQTNE